MTRTIEGAKSCSEERPGVATLRRYGRGSVLEREAETNRRRPREK